MVWALSITNQRIDITWDSKEGAESYRVYWSDRETKEENYRLLADVTARKERVYSLQRSTHIPHYIRICPVCDGIEGEGDSYVSPVHYFQKEQIEQLGRGLVAIPVKEGVFLS